MSNYVLIKNRNTFRILMLLGEGRNAIGSHNSDISLKSLVSQLDMRGVRLEV